MTHGISLNIPEMKYNSNPVEKLNSSNVPSKEWFKTAKKITNRHKTNHIPTLNDKNSEASADEEKANLLKIHNRRFKLSTTRD